MDELSTKIPSLKVVLFGPSNSGKTTFRDILLKGAITDTSYNPTQKTEIVEVIRQFYKKMGGRYVPSETYKLMIADTPGDPRFRDERYKGIQRSVGIIFFYDSTDENSVNELFNLIREEIIKSEAYYNLMGIVLVATKKDLGPNTNAIRLAEERIQELNSLTEPIWGYKIPHIIISCYNNNEVGWAFYILEALIMDKPPVEIITNLSIQNLGKIISLSEVPSKVSEAPMKTPEIKPVEPTVVTPEVKEAPTPVMETRETKVEEKIIEPALVEEKKVERYQLYPSEKIWTTLEKLAKIREDILEVIFFKKTRNNLYHVAFYPGEKRPDLIPKELIEKSEELRSLSDYIASISNIENPSLYIITGDERSLLIIKRRESLLIVKVKGKPSRELIDLLV